MGLFSGVVKVHDVKDLRYTPKGTAVLSFSFAQKNGYDDNVTFDWYQASIWSASAERLAGKIQKGTRCFITGPQKIRTYTKKDGTTGVSIDVSVLHFEFAGDPPAQSTPQESTEENIPF